MDLLNRTPAADLPGLLAAVKALRAHINIRVSLATLAELREWADALGATIGTLDGQPHPDLADVSESDRWITSINVAVAGGNISLSTTETVTITDEQRTHWIASGSAARHGGPKPA